MRFDKLQIDILKDSEDINNYRWHYTRDDGEKILVAPRKATMLILMPQEECKLVLERVADRYETLEKYYQKTTHPEEIEKYKPMFILGTVKPCLQDVMYKLADNDRTFYIYLSPKWLKYVDLEEVTIMAKDNESPVIIKEKGEIVQLVAPIKFDSDWGL